MGIGSDIGGSLRMPAFYCGIFTHKPTTGKLEYEKIVSITFMSLVMYYSNILYLFRYISFARNLVWSGFGDRDDVVSWSDVQIR